jgi:hypothetical protein
VKILTTIAEDSVICVHASWRSRREALAIVQWLAKICYVIWSTVVELIVSKNFMSHLSVLWNTAGNISASDRPPSFLPSHLPGISIFLLTIIPSCLLTSYPPDLTILVSSACIPHHLLIPHRSILVVIVVTSHSCLPSHISRCTRIHSEGVMTGRIEPRIPITGEGSEIVLLGIQRIGIPGGAALGLGIIISRR